MHGHGRTQPIATRPFGKQPHRSDSGTQNPVYDGGLPARWEFGVPAFRNRAAGNVPRRVGPGSPGRGRGRAGGVLRGPRAGASSRDAARRRAQRGEAAGNRAASRPLVAAQSARPGAQGAKCRPRRRASSVHPVQVAAGGSADRVRPPARGGRAARVPLLRRRRPGAVGVDEGQRTDREARQHVQHEVRRDPGPVVDAAQLGDDGAPLGAVAPQPDQGEHRGAGGLGPVRGPAGHPAGGVQHSRRSPARRRYGRSRGSGRGSSGIVSGPGMARQHAIRGVRSRYPVTRAPGRRPRPAASAVSGPSVRRRATRTRWARSSAGSASRPGRGPAPRAGAAGAGGQRVDRGPQRDGHHQGGPVVVAEAGPLGHPGAGGHRPRGRPTGAASAGRRGSPGPAGWCATPGRAGRSAPSTGWPGPPGRAAGRPGRRGPRAVAAPGSRGGGRPRRRPPGRRTPW